MTPVRTSAEATRQAIEFLMLFIEEGEAERTAAMVHIGRVIGEPGPAAAGVVLGQLNLAAELLVMLSAAASADGHASLAHGQAILAELSAGLPE